MPSLKLLCNPLSFYTSHTVRGVHTARAQQRDFDALLTPPPPKSCPVTPSSLSAAWKKRSRSALAQAFAPDIAAMRKLGRRYPGTLELRLTNGPLAGLEIQASAQASLLCLTIKVADRETFERIVGNREVRANELEVLFNRPVALTLQHLNGEPW